MGKVVRLDPPKDGKRRPKPAAEARRRRARKRSKTALVLGGGGFTGAVYEIGALRALDLLAVNRTINEFDVYVGTSAGALVAAMAANGVSPEEMMRVVNRQAPGALRDIDRGELMRPNVAEFIKGAARVPVQLVAVRRARSSWSSSTRSSRSSTTSPRPSRRCGALARAGSATWASRRSATRRSSCSPTSACTRWPGSGASDTRASTSC